MTDETFVIENEIQGEEELPFVPEEEEDDLPADDDLSMSYEEVDGHMINLRQEIDTNHFKLGGLILYAKEKQERTYEEIGSRLFYSEAHCRTMAKVYKVFPRDEDRPYAELTWSHYKEVVATADPHKWLRQAADRNLSVRELRKVVKGEVVKDELREAERILDKVEKFLGKAGQGSEWLEEQLATLLQSRKEKREAAKGASEEDNQLSFVGTADTGQESQPLVE